MEDKQNNQKGKENQESDPEANLYHQTPIGIKPKLSRKLQRKLERKKKSLRRNPR